MTLSYFDRIRPFLSRLVIAPLVTAGASWLLHKTGIIVDADSATVAIDLAIYGAAHRVADKVLNPGDTASAHLAADSKSTAALLKR